MIKFNQNITKAVKLFNEVFKEKKHFIKFLSIANTDLIQAWSSLDEHQQKLIDLAIDALVDNAKVTETRKLQQVYYGEIMSYMINPDKDSLKFITESETNLMKLTQLVTIFLMRKDVDHGHNHEHIRINLRQVLQNF